MTYREALARGRELRRTVPRTSHAVLVVPERDPRELLARQNANRLEDLVALRMERMLASPFTFFRGTAALMALDLAAGARTGVELSSCGDAHISNFGFYGSPARTLVFDLNDFDEAAIAPWEGDVKRLVTSVILGARDVGLGEEEGRASARAAASSYRRNLRSLAALPPLERYYHRMDEGFIESLLAPDERKVLRRVTTKARKRDSAQAAARMTTLDESGQRVFLDDPPVLGRLRGDQREGIEDLFRIYLGTVSPDIALLLSQYRLADIARRVVGVGSVGTRCFVLLLKGPNDDVLILQVKEAGPSVLFEWGGIADARADHEGARVVSHQRILQAMSDPFIGHLHAGDVHYYVRQFRDMKGGVDIARLTPQQYTTFVAGCAHALARAHAQSPHAAVIAGYLGAGEAFDDAVLDWSVAYADQALADYEFVRRSQTPVTR